MSSIPLALVSEKFPRIIGHIMLDRYGELCTVPALAAEDRDGCD